MAAEVMPLGSNGSFLDSPVFTGRRSTSPPSELVSDPIRSSIPTLDLDTSSDNDLHPASTSYTSPSLVATPDSGFSGVASSTRSKTPELETPASAMTHSPSAGSGSGMSSSGRKRKTVTIDESQTSVVVISPDDLFDTYSKSQGQSFDQDDVYGGTRSYFSDQSDFVSDQDRDDLALPVDDSASIRVDSYTGWPLKRSDSLESRDNPFLPGGELCKEAEDLLSRATIIRDTFYLNEEEKQQLQQRQEEQQAEQQGQQKPPRGTKHVSIVDDGQVYTSADPSSSSPPPQNGVVEDRISPQTASNALAAPPSNSTTDVDNHKRENGKANDVPPTSSPDNVKKAIPEGEGQTLPNTSSSPGPGDPLTQGAEKKRKNKCCSVM